MTKKKRVPDATAKRTLDIKDLARSVIEANEERRNTKNLVMQLQDDIVVLHQRIEKLALQLPIRIKR